VENVFGILAMKWRILLRPIETDISVVDKIVPAVVALHNFLIDCSPPERSPALLADHGLGLEENGLWRKEIRRMNGISCGRGGNRHFTSDTGQIRDKLVEYFSASGSVEWQDNFI
jgi:hypothetical protein